MTACQQLVFVTWRKFQTLNRHIHVQVSSHTIQHRASGKKRVLTLLFREGYKSPSIETVSGTRRKQNQQYRYPVGGL